MVKKLLLLLLLMFAWHQGQASPMPSTEELSDGDVFTAQSPEGVEMTFKVISAADKTCMVGTGSNSDTSSAIGSDITGALTIPDYANGYKVTEISYRAFFYSKLTSVTISEGITSIGMWAFLSSTSLTSVHLPSTLTSIGSSAFYGCWNLSQVISDIAEPFEIPVNVFQLHDYDNDINYASPATLYVPTGKKLEYKAFTGWTQFSNIAETGDLTFEVNGIVYRKMGDSNVCLIDGKNASGDYEIPYNVSYEDVWYYVKAIGSGAFANNEALTSVSYNSYSGEIGDNAFSGCTALKSITFGKYVKSIGTGIINGCTALEAVISEIEEPFELSSKAFFTDVSSNSNYKLYVPFGTTSHYQEAGWMSGESRIVEGYDGETFTAETEGENVMTFEVLSAVDKTCAVVRSGIDSNTFVKRKSSDVVIPSEVNGFKVVSIKGEDVFCWVNLNSLTIPASISSIWYHSFDDRDGDTRIGTIHISDLKAWCNVTFEDNPLAFSDHLFFNGEEVKNLTFPEGITCIGQDKQSGKGPFYGYAGLESVTIPDFVTIIGGHAFDGCTNLSNVVIGSGVTKIQAYAFMGCSSLKSITIPDGVTYIGGMAFYGTGLTSVTIPSSVTSIGTSAFSGCSDLTSVKVEIAEPLAFYIPFTNVENLVLYVPKGSKEAYEAADGWKGFKEIIEYLNDGDVFTAETEGGNVLTFKVLSAAAKTCEVSRQGKDRNTIVNSLVSESISIPAEANGFKVVSVGYQAFYGAKKIKSVVIPEGVTSIDTHAFRECYNLASFTFPKSLEKCGLAAFEDCAYNATVHISDLESWCNVSLVSWDLYGWHLLLNGDEVKHLVIPDGVTSIGESMNRVSPLSSCASLTSVVIPNSVTKMYNSFSGCSNLTSVTTFAEKPVAIDTNFPNATVSISNVTLYVPKGSKEAYKDADYWKDFKEIIEYLNDGDVFTAETEGGNVLTFKVLSTADKTCEVARKEYEGNTFVTLASKDVVIPSEVNGFKVVSIGYEALIAKLNSLTIPESLTSIKTGAFENYDRKAKIGEIHITNLTAFCNLKLGDRFPSGFRLYLNGDEVTKLTIPEGLTSVGEDTWENCSPFSDCISLTSVEIPDGVTSIGYGAFRGCSNLTSVSIPKTLTSIGYWAFDGCKNVTSFISYVEHPSDIQNLLCDFGDFCANATLYVPKGSKAAYEAADGWKDFKEIVEVVYGDADGDGDVDPKDVELVVDYIMNGKTEGLHLVNADANGNKVLNVVDIVKMINAIKNR